MSNAFPPGGTYFDNRKSFADVNYDPEKDNAINTTQFLEASESLTTLFDVIGGAAFKPVKSDMQGNIKVKTPKLHTDETGQSIDTTCFPRKSQNANSPLLSSPTPCKTSSATSSRQASTPHPKAFSGSSGKTCHNSNPTLPKQHHTNPIPNRGLDFTAQGLRDNLSKPSAELSESFRAAYGNTLKPHHSFMIKPIFSAAMSATPYRKTFYANLGDDQARVNKELDEWLRSLEKIVSILKEFQGRKEAKW
jgi:hypothetical protein